MGIKMYTLEQTGYGVKIVFQGFIEKKELKRCHREVGELVQKFKNGFGLLHDMRGMKTLPADAREIQKRSMENAKKAGLLRAAQIVDSAVSAMQFKRLSKESDISDTTRQIDASSVSGCEQVAVDWIVKGIDPEN